MKILNAAILSLILCLQLYSKCFAQKKIVVATSFSKDPDYINIDKHKIIESFLTFCDSDHNSPKFIEKKFKYLCNNGENIHIQCYHQVSPVKLYQIFEDLSVDAVFIFAHTNKKKDIPDYTRKNDLKKSFKALTDGDRKFIGLSGCYSESLLPWIKETYPSAVAYGFQREINSSNLRACIQALFKAWQDEEKYPSPHSTVNYQPDQELYVVLDLKITRECNDPAIDYYPEALILDINRNCLGYLESSPPSRQKQECFFMIKVPSTDINLEKREVIYEYVATIFLLKSYFLDNDISFIGKVECKETSNLISGTWIVESQSSQKIVLSYQNF